MRRGNPPHARQRRDLGRSPQHVAARPFQRPQIRLDQGQRKEGHPHSDAANSPHVADSWQGLCELLHTSSQASPRRCSPPSPDNSSLTAHVRGIQARLRQRQAPARQRVRQAEQEPRQDRRHGRRQTAAACTSDAGLATQDARGQGKQRALAFPQVMSRARRRPAWLAAARSTSRASITSSRSGGRQIAAVHGGAHGIGDGIAGARAGVGRRQRIAPPLQPDLAHRRLARDEPAARAPARSRRPPAPAGRRARPAGPAGRQGSGRARPSARTRRRRRPPWRPDRCRVGRHVSRGALPPPWRTRRAATARD